MAAISEAMTGQELAARQEQIREQVRAFVESEIPFELARRIDAEDVYPEELLRRFGDT